MASNATDGGLASVFALGTGPGSGSASGSAFVAASSPALQQLFARLGHVIGALNEYNTFRGTTAPARVATLVGDYTATDEAIIDGVQSQLTSLQSSGRGYASYLQTLAGDILTTMIGEWRPLTDASLGTAITALISLMNAAGATIKASAITASASSTSSNLGNADVIVSTKLKSGLVAEDTFPETMTGTVTTDANSGGATAGRETITFRGQPSATDALSWTWPAGSGSTTSVQAVSALQASTSGRGNWLANGSMETWSVSNVPNGWHYGVGSAGSQFLKSTAQSYDGSASLQFVGDGTTLASVYQQLGVDTTVVAVSSDQVAVHFAIKTDGPPAAGSLAVELVDGTGAIISDGRGTPNASTVDLTGVGTSWSTKSAVFRTPSILPASVSLRFRLVTAITNGKNMWLDHVALAEGVQPYAMGPTIWAFSNSANLIAGDTFAVAIANTPGGFQRGFDRFFNMRSLGYLLPSSASPSIPDSLIV